MEEGVRKEPGGSQEIKETRKGDRASGGLVKNKDMSSSDGSIRNNNHSYQPLRAKTFMGLCVLYLVSIELHI